MKKLGETKSSNPWSICIHFALKKIQKRLQTLQNGPQKFEMKNINFIQFFDSFIYESFYEPFASGRLVLSSLSVFAHFKFCWIIYQKSQPTCF